MANDQVGSGINMIEGYALEIDEEPDVGNFIGHHASLAVMTMSDKAAEVEENIKLSRLELGDHFTKDMPERMEKYYEKHNPDRIA